MMPVAQIRTLPVRVTAPPSDISSKLPAAHHSTLARFLSRSVSGICESMRRSREGTAPAEDRPSLFSNLIP
jgi:hypothetical protein